MKRKWEKQRDRRRLVAQEIMFSDFAKITLFAGR